MPGEDDLKTKRAMGDKVMCFRTGCAVLLLSAAVTGATHAEEAFDAEKTKALFAGTEWAFWKLWGGGDTVVSFARDGRVTAKGKTDWQNLFSGKWVASGSRSITINDETLCEISADKKRIYVTSPEKQSIAILYRGTKVPPDDPESIKILCKPNTIWVAQIEGRRATLAFESESMWVTVNNVKADKLEQCERWTANGGYHLELWLDAHSYEGMPDGVNTLLLAQDKNGDWILKNYYHEFRPEPIQPGDALSPRKINRAASPLSNTMWTTFDSKTGKLRTLSFGANGKANDSAFPAERSEWNHYDNDTVRYKTQDRLRKLTVNMNKGRLMRENNDVREVWFLGKQPPRLGLNEAKQLKERLADKSMAWFNWDAGKKTVYAFDDKSGNVTITKEDGKARSVRWDVLCDGCIRIGSEVFMLEGDALERVEPRLTLKQEPNL